MKEEHVQRGRDVKGEKEVERNVGHKRKEEKKGKRI